MRVRFLADADLNENIVRGVKRKESTVDFATAAEGGLIDLPDSQVLDLAARLGRVLVSHDKRTMIDLFYRFIEARDSPGILMLKQRCSYADAIESLLIVWGASEAEEWINRLEHLPF